MNKIRKYLPFWLGLILIIPIIGHFYKNEPSFGMISCFLIGYFISKDY